MRVIHIREKNNTSRKRLFIAHMMSEEFKEQLIIWKKNNIPLPLRWTPEENLHITIVPPWYEDDIESVIAAIKKIKAYACTLHFTDILPGPSQEQPRLLWTTAKINQKILSTRIQLLEQLQQHSEIHTFTPHVTIGKLFDPEEHLRNFPPFSHSFSWIEEVKEISLVESQLHKAGAIYNVLFSLPLQ